MRGLHSFSFKATAPAPIKERLIASKFKKETVLKDLGSYFCGASTKIQKKSPTESKICSCWDQGNVGSIFYPYNLQPTNSITKERSPVGGMWTCLSFKEKKNERGEDSSCYLFCNLLHLSFTARWLGCEREGMPHRYNRRMGIPSHVIGAAGMSGK